MVISITSGPCSGVRKMEINPKPRAVFMAFGTKGDVYPLAAIAAALASNHEHYHVVFISHAEHQNLIHHMEAKNVLFISVSTPPVLSARRFEAVSDNFEPSSFVAHKTKIRTEHKNECLSAVAKAFGDDPCLKGDFIVINFFALEGWNIAELYQIQCVVAAPYVVPYSAPSSFERCFKKELPFLYKYFHEASANEVCWNDVAHWMWPLFTEEWGKWRSECLHLSSLPFTDPVTNLPTWHIREKSPLLLYGFSKEIVECPGYWPSNACVCGFWFLPLEWQFSCSICREMPLSSSSSSRSSIMFCANHSGLQSFINGEFSSSLTIFIGLSSIGSMGFIRNPGALLSVLEAVIKSASYRFVLFSAGYEPLDAAIGLLFGTSPGSDDPSNLNCGRDCRLLFGDRLLCFSGSAPYIWLFSRCAAVIHHGGSMGFIRNPGALLSVLEAVIKSASYRFVLFSAGYEPLDAAIGLLFGTSPGSDHPSNLNCGRDCRLLFGDSLLCFSGSAPYIWLFSRCAAVIHHGGSGTTAAALHAGVPQIICPFILDQFYWAERLYWLGVAPEPLERHHLLPDSSDATGIKKAADKLTMAINLALSPTMKEQALKIAGILSAEDGVGEALKVLKEHVINPARDGTN